MILERGRKALLTLQKESQLSNINGSGLSIKEDRNMLKPLLGKKVRSLL